MKLLTVFLLFGFLGPRFLKIDFVIHNFSSAHKNFGNISINVNKLDKFSTNQNYLSSEQINNQNIVLKWSKTVLE